MSGRAAEGQAQLAIIERELQDSEARLGALARLADRLDTLRRTIDAQPWTAEKDALVRSLAALDDAQHRLASAGRASVAAALRDADAAPPFMAQQAGPTGNHVGDDARRLPGARFHCRARGDHVADRARVDELSAALRKRAPAPTRRGSL